MPVALHSTSDSHISMLPRRALRFTKDLTGINTVSTNIPVQASPSSTWFYPDWEKVTRKSEQSTTRKAASSDNGYKSFHESEDRGFQLVIEKKNRGYCILSECIYEILFSGVNQKIHYKNGCQQMMVFNGGFN
jgi:hypothetical protein